ncbi:MAG: dihydroorotate dehydrogenase electron transfer subunit [Phycisphaerae bacterium]
MPDAATNPESEVSSARRLDVPLLDRRDAGAEYVRLVLGMPADWVSRPGQFVNVRCESAPQAAASSERRPLEYEEGGEWPVATGLELGRRRWPLVRRPLSVSRLWTDDDRVRIEVLVRKVGTGTHWLARRPVGATLDVVGPLGNHFRPPDPDRLAVLVGGGCGMAPLVGLADHLADLGRQAVLIVGAATADQVPLAIDAQSEAADWRAAPCTLVDGSDMPVATVLATDDGTAGFAGTAVAAAERYLDEAAEGRAVALYGCGPEVMLRALADLARRRDVPCQVSLEEFMGCGIGVCLSCVRKMRDPESEAGWTYRLTCRDGPVVEATEIIWE